VRALGALVAKDAVRVLPAFLPLLLLAGIIGNTLDPQSNGNTAIVMVTIFGGVFGLVNGAIARRDRVDPFLRHRPVRASLIEASPLIVGIGGACLFVCVPWATYTWALSRLEPDKLATAFANPRQATLALTGPAFWIALSVPSVAAWAVMRFAIATPGIVAPVLMLVVMPGFFVLLPLLCTTVRGILASWAIALLVLLIYHGVRQAVALSATRVGAPRVLRSAWALWVAVVLVLAGGRSVRSLLVREYEESGGNLAIQEDGQLRNWRVRPRDAGLPDIEFLSADALRAGEIIPWDEWKAMLEHRGRDGNSILFHMGAKWRRRRVSAGFLTRFAQDSSCAAWGRWAQISGTGCPSGQPTIRIARFRCAERSATFRVNGGMSSECCWTCFATSS